MEQVHASLVPANAVTSMGKSGSVAFDNRDPDRARTESGCGFFRGMTRLFSCVRKETTNATVGLSRGSTNDLKKSSVGEPRALETMTSVNEEQKPKDTALGSGKGQSTFIQMSGNNNAVLNCTGIGGGVVINMAGSKRTSTAPDDRTKNPFLDQGLHSVPYKTQGKVHIIHMGY